MLAILVAFQAASSPAITNNSSPSPEASLVETFKLACYAGSVRLRKDESTPLGVASVPNALRKWYKNTRATTFYKLTSAPDSYLIVFQGDGMATSYKSGCAIATTYMSRKRLWTKITGDTPPIDSRLRRMWNASTREEWPQPKLGYALSARTVGLNYAVVQVSMLNQDEIKRLVAEEQQRAQRFENEATAVIKLVKVPQ